MKAEELLARATVRELVCRVVAAMPWDDGWTASSSSSDETAAICLDSARGSGLMMYQGRSVDW